MSEVRRYHLSFDRGKVFGGGESVTVCIAPNFHGEYVLASDYDALKARSEELEGALNSIATNTCCASCQEAALVARAALSRTKEQL